MKEGKDAVYGILDNRNIERVVLGDYEFDTWYGNAAYFSPQDHSALGVDQMVKGKPRKRSVGDVEQKVWLEKLFVCEYCFNYSAVHSDMLQHRQCCRLNTEFPMIGKLLYRDLQSPYIIKKTRGFKHQLFCQNLSLFSKLFLDDKSVYYNVDYFDFYVIYGYDPREDGVVDGPLPKFKPMGFFSKEVLSWDNNNLACICVFPPFQRLHIGSLLIEFLFALAARTPGQARSGPEFPLSPYGKLTYLRYWSKKISFVVLSDFQSLKSLTLSDLADATGFRKEDILYTLEFMGVLTKQPENDKVHLHLGNLRQWCTDNKVDPRQDKCLLNNDYLLI